jgi:hypothetical protein
LGTKGPEVAFKLLSLIVIFRSHGLKQPRLKNLIFIIVKAEASSKDSQATISLKFRVEIVGDFSFVDLKHPASLPYDLTILFFLINHVEVVSTLLFLQLLPQLPSGNNLDFLVIYYVKIFTRLPVLGGPFRGCAWMFCSNFRRPTTDDKLRACLLQDQG